MEVSLRTLMAGAVGNIVEWYDFAVYGSIASTAVIIGMLLASGLGAILSTCLTHQQLSAWGWRIPFLLGIVVAYTGIYYAA